MFFKRFIKKSTVEKKISLIGWYGQGAHGDDIMEIVTKRLFEEVAKSRYLSLQWVDEKDADVIVVGGGTILGVDRMHLSERMKDVRAPVVFFGGGFRREQRDIGNEYIKRTYKLFQKATLKGVRGYLTQQFLVHIGIDHVEVIGDPALTYTPVPVEKFEGEFKIGVAIRSMGKTGEPQYVDNQTNAQNIALLCDYFAEQYGASLYFFNFAKNVCDDDAEGIEAVIDAMRQKPECKTIAFDRDTEESFSLLGQMDYIISQRLHPTILGWQQGIPHIAFEYQFGKTMDFMSSIGMNEFVIRTDEFSLDTYLIKFRRLWNERDIIRQHAQQSIAYWQHQLYDFANRTLDLLVS